MKKIIFLLSAASILTLSSFNRNEHGTPDKQVVNSFKKDFPLATDVVWSFTQNTHIARFVNNEKTELAYYSGEGKYLGQTWRVSLDEIPAKVKQEILKYTETSQVNSINLFFPPEGYPKFYAVSVIDGKKILREIDLYGQSSIVWKKRIPVIE